MKKNIHLKVAMEVNEQNLKMAGRESSEDITEQNLEMADFLQYFQVEERNLNKTIIQLEENVNAIRSHIESKSKKITMKQLDAKLEMIIKILSQNGLVCKE